MNHVLIYFQCNFLAFEQLHKHQLEVQKLPPAIKAEELYPIILVSGMTPEQCCINVHSIEIFVFLIFSQRAEEHQHVDLLCTGHQAMYSSGVWPQDSRIFKTLNASLISPAFPSKLINALQAIRFGCFSIFWKTFKAKFQFPSSEHAPITACIASSIGFIPFLTISVKSELAHSGHNEKIK